MEKFLTMAMSYNFIRICDKYKITLDDVDRIGVDEDVCSGYDLKY